MTKVCAECGNGFESKRSHRLTCSSVCKQRRWLRLRLVCSVPGCGKPTWVSSSGGFSRTHRCHEHKREYELVWTRKNRDRVAASARNGWLRKSPVERHLISFRRRYGGSLTLVELEALWVLQGGRCVFCNVDLTEIRWHIDHRTPIVRGGSSEAANLQILCVMCNRGKSSMMPEEYVRHCEAVLAHSVGLVGRRM